MCLGAVLLRPLPLRGQAVGPAPFPYVPPQSATPITDTPLGRALWGSSRAIEAARTADPAAAQRAYAFDLRARQQVAAGDVSGALASAALAQSAALTGAASNGLPPAQPFAAPAGSFPEVPLARTGVVLPGELLAARTAIERATATGHDSSLGPAKAHYRRALDAYLTGDLAREVREARLARSLVTGPSMKGP